MKPLFWILSTSLFLTACLPEKKKASAPQTTPDAAAQKTTESTPQAPVKTSEYHIPPQISEIPEGPFGDSVRRGADIFRNTPKYAAKYVGNSQSCANCHIDYGRQPLAAPMWAAWVSYPAYRKKNDHVNTMEERIQGCFTFSENAQASEHGSAPPNGDPVLVDLQAFAYWLAQGVPTGEKVKGRGFLKIEKPAEGYSVERGKEVYTQHCAVCHGDDGQGLRLEDGHLQFPPLWGAEAYNWGAGMHRINDAAGFIKQNMPLGKSDLTDQQSWDVAAYINSKPRPKDPRQTASVADTDKEHHDEECAYGETQDGIVLGTGVARAKN